MNNNTNENKIMVDTFVEWIYNLSGYDLSYYNLLNKQQLSFDKQILCLIEWYIRNRPKKYEKLYELQEEIKCAF